MVDVETGEILEDAPYDQGEQLDAEDAEDRLWVENAATPKPLTGKGLTTVSEVWDGFDDAGWDPLAAPDPPRDMEPDTEDDPRIDTIWDEIDV